VRWGVWVLGVGLAALLGAGPGCAPAQRPRPRIAAAFRLVCTPRNAVVIVDEITQGACVLYERQYLGVGPGTHRLRIERDGYLPVEREITADGRRQTLEFNLRERPE
jgi:hypothetical protein